MLPEGEAVSMSPRVRSVMPPEISTCPVPFTRIAAVVLFAPLAPMVQFWSTVSVLPLGMMTVSPLPGVKAPVHPDPVHVAVERGAVAASVQAAPQPGKDATKNKAIIFRSILHPPLHAEGRRHQIECPRQRVGVRVQNHPDRKSTRLKSSHLVISYAVFCL